MLVGKPLAHPRINAEHIHGKEMAYGREEWVPPAFSPQMPRPFFASHLVRLTCFSLLTSLGSLPALAATSNIEESRSLAQAAHGPWGSIEYFYIYLEAPEALMERFPLPGVISRWALPKAPLPDVGAKLRDCGLSEADTLQLLTSPSTLTEGDWIYLFPPTKLLVEMKSETRANIYQLLDDHPHNAFHQNPIFFPGGSVDLWAEGSSMKADHVNLIKSLTYERDGITAFSDVPAVLQMASGEREARAIYRQLTRTRTIMARLMVTDDTDIQKIMEYWTTGLNLRRKEMEPILRSVQATHGAAHLDLVHLLPALARKLVFTYPDSEMTTQGLLPDCHWTTLNFFNYSTQNFYLTQSAATSAVLENFDKVDEPYRFGDVLMFLNENGEAIHSCNYIAADIVFTKNGRTPAMPWMLMELADQKRIYRVKPGGNRIVGFRHKQVIAAGK